jgi:single-strand DNA-binding protein
MNVVVVGGRLSRPAELRTLGSGELVLGLEVTVRSETIPTETVPVAWTNPPAWAQRLVAGDDLIVVGRVRRRFFRAGGATQSRTEVVVEGAARPSQRAKAATLIEAACARALEAAA